MSCYHARLPPHPRRLPRFPAPLRHPPAAPATAARGEPRRPRTRSRPSARACRGAAPLTHRHRDRRRQRTALRGAHALLPALPRATAQVLVVLLSDRPRISGPGRGGHARAHLRTGADRRWTGDPRARMRLGLPDALDGREISARADHRSVQLGDPETAHRRRVRAARADERDHHHVRHEPLRAGLERGTRKRQNGASAASTAWSRWRCSST